ncbi:Site-specific DNA recombinase [Sphingopyxis sp. YR583]|uniref:recombinase family protein n=1 Tax=Sphingopyxis sp. YR583 TaxID=1881047 RepID=UPI0008A72695|nr:recombinase family protein [Sphingopyxis sp. YR583]SEH14847.1 Site-specific DNA recombinase [Sphingopyxis sp. YR583]
MSESSEQYLVPVAQYLRMSKDHQRYSIRNQARAISAYAAQHGLNVVKTYTDPGESGLTLRERPGLQALLSDVIKPERIFERVLVLDVSRWGRFQNLDQAGHYEFICFEAGAPVIYCAELFENDGTPVMALLKQIKRLQAAEFSRELSGKVLHAQLLQAKIGHKVGGPRRFGFERMLVDEHDWPIQILKRGESKALNNQRVVYVRGSDAEVKVIRDIFTWYTRDRMSLRQIAKHLNELQIPAGDRPTWSENIVRRILSDELALGIYVFNRRTQRLKSKSRKNPPEALIKTKVTDPIVSRVQFDSAARRLKIRRHGVSPEENLAAVARLLRSKGYLTGKLIDKCPYTQSTTVLRRQFGSIHRVYELVGYQPEGWVRQRGGRPPLTKDDILARLRRLHDRVGYVNEHVINDDPSVPSVSVIQLHFGKLTEAYRLAGLPYGRTELQRLGHERLKAKSKGKPIRSSPTRWAELLSRFSDDDLLDCLRRLHKQHGYVTAQIIREDDLSPTPLLFARRFGTLLNAYARAGIENRRFAIWSRAGKMRAAVTRAKRQTAQPDLPDRQDNR